MKKTTLWIIACFAAVSFNSLSAQNIIINEILSSNSSINKDEDNSYEDWVELYNNGAAAENLSGYGLTDDSTLPFKWTFPAVTMAPGSYLLIWCSSKNRIIVGQPLHTNFKISASGETITLTKPDSTIADSVPATAIPSNISFGRSPNITGNFAFYEIPTPAAANGAVSYSEILSPPTFSLGGGFFTTPQILNLSTTTPGATIIYTVDGSDPDPANLAGTTYDYKNVYEEHPGQPTGAILHKTFQSLQYSTPINVVDRSADANKISAISTTYDNNPAYIPTLPVFKGTVVRAKIFKDGALSSPTVSQTYIISSQGSGRFALPVVSIGVSENKLFDYNEGIAVAGVDFDQWRAANPTLEPEYLEVGNYYRRGIENEREANMSYFVNGQSVLNQNIGIRIHGGSTRAYSSKSISLYARSNYGSSNMNYKFFNDRTEDKFETLVLRNSGGDFLNTMFRDALNSKLVKPLHCEVQSYQPTVTLVDGEYFGILNLREKYDDKYFTRVCNIPSGQLDLLENQGEIDEGDTADFDNLVDYMNNNTLTSDANYNYIQTRLDPESFADYYIANIFVDNADWPGTNVTFWRKKVAFDPTAPYGNDGRWRWAFHDMDDTFSFGTNNFNDNALAHATATNGPAYPNPAWSTLFLRRMLGNVAFKNYFINRFADLMNTTYLPTNVISNLNEMKNVIYSSIPEHITRWKSPASMSDYDYYIQYETNFANARPAFQRNHIRGKFGIASNINIALDVSDASQGYVKISTIDIKLGTPGIASNPYPWTGIYFSNIPIKIKAIANNGFVFDHWEGASTATTDEITMTEAASFSLKAIFIPAIFAVETSVPINFWLMDGAITNNLPLTSLTSTYEIAAAGIINYQSSLAGYPFTSANPLWRHASMERRNAPTPINYRPEANGNVAYSASLMKGLQITQPFQNAGLENTMAINLSTKDYKKVKFSFAAMDEGAATGISIDYSTNSGAPIWITTGLASTSLGLTTGIFQLYEVDLSAITSVDNNPDFKIRMRFTGPNMTADTGARVTFNNIALDGVKLPLIYNSPNVFTVGVPIANLIPTVAASVTSYSITPGLPAGLSFDTTTGVISGTPTAISATAVYTVTATNAGGNVSYGISITVNDIAPTLLSYTSPNVFTVGSAISDLNPTVSGSVNSYSVNQNLPAGLSLNTTTGVISGTPTAIAPTAIYTVTATNSGGSVSFDISITVNDIAPTLLSYNSPNVFTVGSLISDLSPTISGSVNLYSVNPNLPNGLSINSTTGVISGTPTAISATAIYTVTATNSGGSVSFDISITVNDIAPTLLSYNSPNVFTVGSLISDLSPTISGSVNLYSVNPNLPSGLSFDSATGVISGTPTSISATAIYTVTATNSGGSVSFDISITVNDIAPTLLSYNSPNIFTVGSLISDLSPTISGSVNLYSVNPNLPSGLSFDSATGIISGTPTSISATAIYTVTATNSGGSVSFGVSITVNDIAPTLLSYNSPNIYTVGSLISDLNPTISGSVNLYSVNPNLPSGLSFDSATGVISGTPTAIAATAIYTVTATNSGGSISFDISITVNDIAPTLLSYNSPNIYTVGSLISDLNPTVSGVVNSYSVNPSLPGGLSLNTITGVISGTPTAIAATAIYTVTATNSGGSVSFDISITVNDVAPTLLSYNSPNVFTIGSVISVLNPTVSGSFDSFSVNPNLPNGLSIDSTTGVISGTPTAIAATAIYTVIAINSTGSVSFDISITVNDIAPTFLSYNSPNVFTVGTSIQNLIPNIIGNATNYTIFPALPAGLLLNTLTGIISGTPSEIASVSTYHITATNSGGSVSFDISITVNDIAPTLLSYNSPNVFTVGNSIADLMPTVAGGAVISYSISPTLPSGLFFTPEGIITGTPVTVTSTAIYTVTAANSGGSISFGVEITINDLAPSILSYNTPNVFTVGVAIGNLVPTIAGNVTNYSIMPDLPDGLILDAFTGIISGTPTATVPLATYTVTAVNSGGSISFAIEITVNDVAPSDLIYPTPIVLTINSPVTINPDFAGNATNFSITCCLPPGLTFDPTTGTISGTPTTTWTVFSYTVTATNAGGSTSTTFTISVVNQAPLALSYNSPNIFNVGTAIADLAPTVSGTEITYSISPQLPNGLLFDSATGIISGTPSEITSTGIYTVTATNSGGSISFDVEITVDAELGVTQHELVRFAVYPNPFTNYIVVKGMESDADYKLFSIDGKMIQKGKLNNSEIDLRILPDGVYTLQVGLDQNAVTRKIIKQD